MILILSCLIILCFIILTCLASYAKNRYNDIKDEDEDHES